jgi:hypothetical protein
MPPRPSPAQAQPLRSSPGYFSGAPRKPMQDAKDTDTKTTAANTGAEGSAKQARGSKLVAFGLPLLVCLLGVGSMAATVFFGKDKMLKGKTYPAALAAVFYAVAPLFAAWRLGGDAVRGFKAAGVGAKVGRVLALLVMAVLALVHVLLVVRLASSPFNTTKGRGKSAVDLKEIMVCTAIGAVVGLAATLAVLVREGAARVASKAVRITLYVLLAVLVAVLLVGYFATLAVAAKGSTRPESAVAVPTAPQAHTSQLGLNEDA